MEDFLIDLVGTLDESSKSKLDSDIDEISKKLKELKLKGTIESTEVANIEKKLKKLKANISKVTVDSAAITSAVNQINKGLKGIKISNIGIDTSQSAKIGQKIGNQLSSAIKNNTTVQTDVFNTDDLDKQGRTYVLKVNNTIEATKKTLESKLRNAGYFDIEIKGTEKANGQIESLVVTATNAKGVFEQLNFERAKMQKGGKVTNGLLQSNNVKIIGDMTASVSKMQNRLDSMKSKWEQQGILVGSFKEKVDSLETTLSSVASKSGLESVKTQLKSLNDEALKLSKNKAIQLKIDNGDFDAKYTDLIAKTRQWSTSLVQSKTNVKELNNAYKDFADAENDADKIEAAKRLQEVIKTTTNDVRRLNAEYAKDSDISSLHQQVQEFYDKNSAAHKNWGTELLDILKKTEDGAELTKTEIENLGKSFNNVKNNARQAGELGLSFFDSVKQQAKKFAQWFSITSVISTGISEAKKMAEAVYEIDTAMTSLYKVTDETADKYESFLNNASKDAQELGRSVSSLVEQTASWAKLGYNIDDSATLAKTSSIYANVGEVDDETAVSDIVTAMKAFNIEAKNSISIVDRLNKLGNEYASDSASLGEGLKKSASALALAGNDINQALAMITGGTEITQNASEMGNAIKVLSMRLRGMKGELEDLGEEYEDVQPISKIQTQILNRTGGAVNIFDDVGNFKSTYEIIEDIAEVWDHISQTDQADLLEIIAGKQRGNQIAALIQSFQSGQAQNAYVDAVNSAGSAMQEQSRWMESLEAKIQKFKAAFESLSNTIIDSDFLKFLVDSGTTVINVLDTIISNVGVLGTALAGFGGYKFIKNFDQPKIQGCPSLTDILGWVYHGGEYIIMAI